MSYNISTFKLKNINITLPKSFSMEQFYEKTHKKKLDWLTPIEFHSDGTWNYGEEYQGFSMEGLVTDKGLEVTHITCSGDGSGHDYSDILLPLFEKYKGDLECVQIWEGGDSIQRTTITNGIVKEEEIDL